MIYKEIYKVIDFIIQYYVGRSSCDSGWRQLFQSQFYFQYVSVLHFCASLQGVILQFLKLSIPYIIL